MDNQNNQYIDPNAMPEQGYMQQPLYQQAPPMQPSFQDAEYNYGPRKMSFFTLVLKTFAGMFGGAGGSMVLLLIFLSSSSILNPVLGATVEAEASQGEVSALFMAILMGMIFATSVVSSMLSAFLLCYTERDRYTRIATAMSQIFIMNIAIFICVLPVYLTTSTARLELTAFAAVLQVILSATASALILELVHDRRYALLAVYNTILAILIASGVNFFLYFIFKSATILLFVAVPIIWTSIGFIGAAFTMIYFWIFQTWGSDFLAYSKSFGSDYGVPDQSEEEEEEENRKPDVEGGNFFRQ